jgi:hypothetical protein
MNCFVMALTSWTYPLIVSDASALVHNEVHKNCLCEEQKTQSDPPLMMEVDLQLSADELVWAHVIRSSEGFWAAVPAPAAARRKRWSFILRREGGSVE